jgi:hypothetical protein
VSMHGRRVLSTCLLEFEMLKVGVDIEESIIEVVVWQERVAFVYFQFTE